ncbi:hypothetical protein [Persicitalea jodogahamensis]|uniref:Uncharacterized protein n=1 Tax=Persicitalea jodogahamensis TaxID=402147 RepID=A0A8J3G8B8_9BACT|nr:hypothetical protein [Persicitalea jodogahamensis]GHB54648.1 hypothetical protein GCM10007390_04660 [Persicitalea jodogahamensis]
MEFIAEIACIGRGEEINYFKYARETSKENGNIKWIFKIKPSDLDETDWFEFSITKINETMGKVTTMLHNYLEVYVAKGIPEKMIEEASQVLNLRIISSSNNPKFKSFGNESRSSGADKVWKRLVEQGKATYDSTTDTYEFLS